MRKVDLRMYWGAMDRRRVSRRDLKSSADYDKKPLGTAASRPLDSWWTTLLKSTSHRTARAGWEGKVEAKTTSVAEEMR